MSRDFGPASWWGLFGVLAMLLNAVVRLTPKALEALAMELGWAQLLGLGLWVGFMLYTEGYRGFHLRFSPMVVARAETLAGSAPLHHKLLAPVYCMGLFHATRRRLVLSWGLISMIICLVMAIRFLDQPWRGLIDAGVVAGLAAGTASIGWWALVSRAELVSPELPVAAVPSREA